MRQLVILSVIGASLVAGCAPMKAVVSAPDVLNPVSISPAVSTAGKNQSIEIGNLDASSLGRLSYSRFLFQVDRSTEMQRDDIQPRIMQVTQGQHDRAIRDLQIEASWSYRNIFLLLGAITKEEVKSEISGIVVRVK